MSDAKDWLKQLLERGRKERFTWYGAVGPDKAEALLELNGTIDQPTNHKPVNQHKITRFVNMMLEGKWMDNGESVIISSDGNLNDAQHRLWAVFDSETTQMMLLVFGVARNTVTTVDTGGSVTPGSVFKYLKVANPSVASGIVRRVIRFELGGTQKFANAELISVVNLYPRYLKDRVNFDESAMFAASKKSPREGTCSRNFLGAFHYLLSKADSVEATWFLERVAGAGGMSVGCPAITCREDLLSLQALLARSVLKGVRVHQETAVAEIVINHWNNHIRKGRDFESTPTRRLTGEIPKIMRR